MKPIEIPMPISAQVADAIRKEILKGTFSEGQKISVKIICDRLEVSATPVKEAFKILQTEGLLKTVPRSGTFISDFAEQSLQSMAHVRAALEGSAVYIATKVASDDELEGIQAILDKTDTAIRRNDIDALVSINTAFHKSLRQASHNQYLISLIDQLISFDYTFRKTALTDFAERIEGTKEHREILGYMKARNADAAEQTIIRHIRRTAEEVVRFDKKEKTT